MSQTVYRCESCKRDVNDGSAHEHHYHGGAQTCWTAEERAAAEERQA